MKDSAWPLARTLDHIVADYVGQQTPFKTLEFSCNNHTDNKESIYFDNISWYGTGHVAPSIRDPRKMYQRLFSTRMRSINTRMSILVLDDARDLKKQLGPNDKQKLDEYFESIRSIELQLTRLEKIKTDLAAN